jgi:hypothetical protein
VDQLSTEPIARAAPHAEIPGDACTSCGAPLASDQRYCLQCGERRASLAAFPGGQADRRNAQADGTDAPSPASPPSAPPGWRSPGAPSDDETAARNGGLLLLAGIGLLLLAMGIGVLIGRSGAKQAAAPAQVVTVASASGATGPGSGEEASFSDDWPSGKKGFTVQLQTLPSSGTSKGAVEQAKSAATAKGASAVGALLSDHFSSLTAGSYVVYSGIYSKRAEAQKALMGLRGKFPGAKVIEVSAGSGGGGGSKEPAASGSGSNGAGSSLSKPAPPSALEGVSKAHGKSYEEKSKNLPDVISTG